MKIIAFVLASLVCLLNCSNGANVSSDNTLEGRSAQPAANTLPADVRKLALVGSLRVDSYENNELLERFFFKDGSYVKRITHNTQTGKKEREIAFFYKKNGELDHAKIDGEIASKEDSFEIRRSFDDFEVHSAMVKSKGVIFPLPIIAADEVRDLSDVLSVAVTIVTLRRMVR